MSPESQAALRLAEQCDEAIAECEFCGVRGHRVRDCIHYSHYFKTHQRRSDLREFLRTIFILACGFLAGAVWERMVK